MPVKPTRLVLVLAGFALSLFLAVLAVLLTEWIAQVRGTYGKENADSVSST